MKKFDRYKFNRRVEKLLADEFDKPQIWHYLSFAGEDKFLGVVVIQAHGIIDAVLKCKAMEINPGGEVMCWPMIENGIEIVPESDRNRLLSREDVHRIWPDAKSIAEHEAENAQ